MIENLIRGPLGHYYTERELNECWKFLDEAFAHYECFDPSLQLWENMARLIGSHMHDAEEVLRQRMINANAWFYGKETFRLGEVKIDTKLA